MSGRGRSRLTRGRRWARKPAVVAALAVAMTGTWAFAPAPIASPVGAQPAACPPTCFSLTIDALDFSSGSALPKFHYIVNVDQHEAAE